LATRRSRGLRAESLGLWILKYEIFSFGAPIQSDFAWLRLTGVATYSLKRKFEFPSFRVQTLNFRFPNFKDHEYFESKAKVKSGAFRTKSFELFLQERNANILAWEPDEI